MILTELAKVWERKQIWTLRYRISFIIEVKLEGKEAYNMKLGIIGTGGIVQEFLPHLASGKGLNVIVEKPMASNYIEAQKLKQLVLDNKCFLFEAITTVYLGNYLKIKEWLNRIGDIMPI